MLEKLDVPVSLPLTYYKDEKTESMTQENSSLFLVLHGYRENATIARGVFSSLLCQYGRALYVDGLFPVPRRGEKGWEKFYGWYFYDERQKQYLVDMEPSIEALKCLVKKKHDTSLPITIIGFSQGGYLAPFVAETLSDHGITVKMVIGIGARLRTENWLKQKPNFPIYCLHGEDDVIVELKRAQKCFQDFLNQGGRGEFIAIPQVGHEVNSEVLQVLKGLIHS